MRNMKVTSDLLHSMDIHHQDTERKHSAKKVDETAMKLVELMFNEMIELKDEQFLSSTAGEPRFDAETRVLRFSWLGHDLILEALGPAWLDPETEDGPPKTYRRGPVVKILVRSESELFFEITVLTRTQIFLPILPGGNEIMHSGSGYEKLVVNYLFNWFNQYLRPVYQPAFFTESSGRTQRSEPSTRLSIINGTD